MTLKGGRKAGQFNDLDEVSQAAGGQVTLTADIAAIGPTQRAPGMPIRDVSQTPPVTWVFVQGDVSPAAFNVIVPNVEPDTGVMPGRWKAGSPLGGDAWVQGGNSFGAVGVLGTNDAFDLAFEAGGTEIMRLDQADRALVIGGNNADPSALLQLDSTAKGLLIPRLTTAQKNAVANPANGLVLFDTDLDLLQFNSGTPGAPVWSPAAATWVQGGNSFGANGVIGTNDNFDMSFETNNVTRITILRTGLTGIGTATPQSGLDLNVSTIERAVPVADLAGGGPIGASAATVDVASMFEITQTTAGQTLTLPNPTNTQAGRRVGVINVGTAPFLMHGAQIQPDTGAWFEWEAGLAWRPIKSAASQFAYSTLAGDQAAVAAGTDIIFDQAVTTRGIALNVVTGVFSLTAGHTYEIEANILARVGAAGISDFQWVDAGTNAVLIATQAGARIVTPQLAADTAGQTCAKLIYTPAANQDIKLRCVAAVAATTIVAFGTYAAIKEIQ